MCNYYVYVYIHPITLLPFYVGFGKEQRINDHLEEASGVMKGVRSKKNIKNKRKLNTIIKILSDGLQPIIQKYKDDLSKENASTLEIELIARYGRLDLKTGSLTNMTAGGDGTREWSDKAKLNVSKRHKGTVVVKDANGNKFRININDQRLVSGEVVGLRKGVQSKTKYNEKTFPAKDINNNIFRITKDDPRWISGELMGLMKNVKAHANTITSAKAQKGKIKGPQSETHRKNLSLAKLKYYENKRNEKISIDSVN